jgi:glutathione peroxidase
VTINRRVSAEIDGGFVLFLIGMRINRPWRVRRWLPVLSAMPKMLRELEQRPELGLLHYRLQFGFRAAMVVQYWRSFEQLTAYAAARDKAHLPAWAAFNKAVGTGGDVGIWHETYIVEPGKYESIYVNMPAFGLGAAGSLVDATGRRASAKTRVARADDDSGAEKCQSPPDSQTGETDMTQNVYDIPLKTIDGKPASLADYKGKVLLVVNVASKCGLTPQYEGLQKLYEAKHDAGLEVLGFPANNFAGQEPGSDAEIKEFCDTKFHVSFPLFGKISVVGDDKHPLYQALTEAQPVADGGDTMRKNLVGYGMTPNPEPEVLWNFEKFVIGKDGKVVGRFTPDTAADSPALLAALDKALAA